MTLKEAAAIFGQWADLRDVAPADMRELIERGLLLSCRATGHVELDVPAGALEHGWPAVGLASQPPPAALVDELRQIGNERRAWRSISCDRYDAAVALSLDIKEFDALAADHGVQPGRLGRYAWSDIDRLRVRPAAEN